MDYKFNLKVFLQFHKVRHYKSKLWYIRRYEKKKK